MMSIKKIFQKKKECCMCGYNVEKDKEYTVKNNKIYCKECVKHLEGEDKKQRFIATTSNGLYCYDRLTNKRYDAVDNFYDMMELLNQYDETNKELKQYIKVLERDLRREITYD